MANTAPHVDAPPPPSPEVRARLVGGFMAAINDKSFAATTIADIVRHARVSKRTFYEHFVDKDACFLAAYEAASTQTMIAIASSVDLEATWQHQIRSSVRAYLQLLEANAAMTRTFLLEVHAAGPAALALRRQVHDRFADMLRQLAAYGRMKHPELAPMSAEMAAAIVGGINELVLVALERPGGGSLFRHEGSQATLPGLENTATQLFCAVLLAPQVD